MLRGALLAAALAAALSGCETIPIDSPTHPFNIRINELEKRNQDLASRVAEQNRLLGGLNASGLGTQTAGLEEQVRELRGQLEKLRFELNRNDQRGRDLYVDIDRRLSVLEGRPSSVSSGGQSAVRSQPSQSTAGRLVGRESEVYMAAFGELKGGDYNQAIGSFRGFLNEFPDSAYAGNAQYWVGEAYYVQQKYDQALSAFEQVPVRFPDSSKVPDALLKKGYILVEQKKMSEAHAVLKSVASKYADSTAGRLAREKLAAIGVP